MRATLVCALVILVLPAAAGARVQPRPHRARPSATAAIVGGEAATAGTFPSVAEIVYNLGNGMGEFCTGTVVSSNVVLTAGHCVEDLTTGTVDAASNFTVYTGSVDPTDAPDQALGVSEVLPYPDFDLLTDSGDAGLLVLSTPTTAPAMTLATAANVNLIQAGNAVAVAGWGLTDPSDSMLPYNLQWAVMGTQSPAFCAEQADPDGLGFDPTYEFCAIDPTNEAISTCHGDSGGPVLATPAAGQLVEVGIIDRGDANCATTIPSIFTRVDLVQPWVAAEIASLAPPPAAPAPAPTPPPATTPSATSTTTPATPAPSQPSPAQAGRYTGRSSQHRGHVDFTLGTSGVTKLQLEFNLRCTRGRRERGPYTEASAWRSDPIQLVASQGAWTFTTRYRDTTGDHYTVSGAVSSSGLAAGTMTVSRRSGACTTGLVKWSASVPAT